MINKELLKRNLKVLIVDDLPSARRVTKKLLRSLMINDIVEAADGSKAMEILKKGGIDLVISDWRMPDIEGIELVKLLRAEKRFEKLPFIMMTSYSDKDVVVTAVQAGISDFIAKPFNAAILGEKINKVFGFN